MATIPSNPSSDKGPAPATPGGKGSVVGPAASNGAGERPPEIARASTTTLPAPAPATNGSKTHSAADVRPAQPVPADQSVHAAAPANAGSKTIADAAVEAHRSDWIRMAPSWLTSMLFHVIVLLVMALWFNPVVEKTRVELTASTVESPPLEDLSSNDIQPLDVTALDSTEMEQSTEDIMLAPTETFAESISDDIATNSTIELDVDGGQTSSGVLTQSISRGMGESLSGIRAGPNKAAAIRKGGGNDASELAVAAALKWLTEQQMLDNGWTFDLRRTPHPCSNPGQADQARAGATAMAVLPFLAAGHTPKEGKYAPQVRKGLTFLASRAKAVNTRFGQGVSWHEQQGRMYSHGLASIAFCEAYAMTHDKALQPYAQASLNFIEAAQLFDGGWRYDPPPEQPGGGDTSVVGWQVMALKSGSMGYQLSVQKQTLLRAYEFLNKIQTDDGAAYGYTNRNDRQKDGATTAIGLLCRMYFGWKKDNPALQRGVENLSKRGPSTGPQADMYYNYYATQVMHHWGGEEWEKWNKVMRDFLIETQAKKGAETGSWYFDDPSDHGAQGQRLYVTSLATMTLEVYYRHLPLYQKSSTEAEFKP